MTEITFTEDEKDELRRICSEAEFVEFTKGLVNELVNNPHINEELPEPEVVNKQLEQLYKDINKCSNETKRHISNTYSLKTGHLTFDILFELQKCLAIPYKRPKGKPSRRSIYILTAIIFDHFNLKLDRKKDGKLYKYLEIILRKSDLEEMDLPELAKKTINAAKEAKQIMDKS